MLAIAICTRNPDCGVLSQTINAIASQSVLPANLRIVVVDNASNPPLTKDLLGPLLERKVRAKIVIEPNIGIIRARIRAIQETTADWLLFIDDDSEIFPNFIEQGLKFIAQHPEVGCVGGKLILPEQTTAPTWTRPFLPYLAIRDFGDNEIIGMEEEWGPWEPVCAAAFVHRKVLIAFLERSRNGGSFFNIGQAGKRMGRCEDSLLMRGAFYVGLASAYVPQLVSRHHICSDRFRLPYLLRLMGAYGRSQVLLETVLKGFRGVPEEYEVRNFLGFLGRVYKSSVKQSPLLALGLVAWHIAARREYLSMNRSVPVRATEG
jgi:glycosyltransferase involved in cell wall biosynthesis